MARPVPTPQPAPSPTPTTVGLDRLITGLGAARASEQSLRTQHTPDQPAVPAGSDRGETPLNQDDYLAGLAAVQQRLLDAGLDEDLRPTADPDRRAWQRAQVETHARHTLTEHAGGAVTNPAQREDLIAQWVDDIVGLGPAEPLYQAPDVTELVILGPRRALVERRGQLSDADIAFRGHDHLVAVAQRLAVQVGRAVDEANPMVDTRLPDGTRVHIVFPPIALDGVIITIRRHPPGGYTLDDLRAAGLCSTEMADLLRILITAGANLVISGPTTSGKTTLLKALAREIPDHEYIVVIEDLAELDLAAAHRRTASLEARPADSAGRGEITVRQLLRNALRMRPDRIIVGEVRNHEALDMLQAMNTGHDGSLTTLHANSVEDAVLRRIPNMATQAGEVTLDAARRDAAAVIDAGIQLRRTHPSGRRVIDTISAVVDEPGTPARVEHIYRWNPTTRGWDPHPVLAPRLVAKIEAAGFTLSHPPSPRGPRTPPEDNP